MAKRRRKSRRLGDAPPHPLVSKSFRTPKGCHVRYVQIRPEGAEVGYDCGGGGRGSFPTPSGGWSNYPKALVKGTRSVRTPGAHVSGHGADVGFELSPRWATCRKRAGDSEMACSIHTSSGVLSGGRRRRRKKR